MSCLLKAVTGTPHLILILVLMFIGVKLVISVLAHVLLSSLVQTSDQIQTKAHYISTFAPLVLNCSGPFTDFCNVHQIVGLARGTNYETQFF